MQDTAKSPAPAPAKAGDATDRGGTLDPATRLLLRRFVDDWIWPRRRAVATVILLTVVLSAATASYPLIIKTSFDSLKNGGSVDLLPFVGTAIVLATATRATFLYLQTTAMWRLVYRISTDMQRAGFANLVHSDYARLTRETPGHLVSRLTNDIAAITLAVHAGLGSLIRDTLMILGLLCSMFYLDWMLTLVAVCVYPFATFPVARFSGRLRNVSRRTQRELGDMTSLLTEKLTGTRLIKAFRLEDYASRLVNASFEQVFALRQKAAANRARMESVLEAAAGIGVAGVFAFAYWRITSGASTVGDFMGFVTALLMAAQPMRALGSLYGKVMEGLAAVENFYQLVDEKPTIHDKPDARPLAVDKGLIRFQDVAFGYDAASPGRAVQNFTLDVPGGKTVALVGRSGAGKSTVLNLVPRLFEVTRGAITIDGQDVRDVTIDSLRNAISIVSQDVTLFDDTIRANIALGKLDASEAEIVAAAKAAAAHEFILAQPSGYDTVIGDAGQRLSGGQRQRLALARAILKDAPILLLDEATSALDSESEQLVQEALARFTKGRTTLVIAHRLSTIHNADLICVMDHGAIADLGTHAELMARNGSYARLYRSQLLSEGVSDESAGERQAAVGQ